jgi:2-keto-4-pentenoate hydratase/2-oxohepta-3-ene-1,7-dioic acid hydratase in catechol pathway
MRIVRFSPPSDSPIGADPRFGILEDESTIRLIASDPLYAGVFEENERFDLDSVRLLAPVLPRSKVVCVGKNYADHAAEMGGEVPQEPIIFIKPNTSVIGPGDLISWPRISERIDHEAELAIVISKICKEVPRERADDVIFGYTIANDVTARDLQSRDGQWTRAKSFDTFCPIGPWIDTDYSPADQLITARVNGDLKQSAPLSDMVFDIPTIISFVTEVMTLLPGDIILTGTPSGVGPMTAGGSVEVAIEGLGLLRNRVSERGK